MIFNFCKAKKGTMFYKQVEVRSAEGSDGQVFMRMKRRQL